MVKPEQEIIAASRALIDLGLNQGTSGNISLRGESGILMTPSSLDADEMDEASIALLAPVSGNHIGGTHPASSEWRFHVDIYAARPEVNAIVHCHAPYATALSTLRAPIPAVHYMIAIFGGTTVPCTRYETFGTAALSRVILEDMGHHWGALMGNHGLIACGETLSKAMWRAQELEALAKIYWLAKQAGTPHILHADEIERVKEKIAAGYGKPKDKNG